MFCTKCGLCLPDEARFCTRCGAAITAPVVPQQPVQQPVYQQPAYQQPVYPQPMYQQPVYQQPAYQQPPRRQPSYQKPGYWAPAPQQPVYRQPVYQQPVYPQPAYQQPVYQPPAQPVMQPVPEPVAASVAEPVAEPVVAPVAEPVPEPVVAPVAEPVPEPVAAPVAEPVPEPVAAPVAEPVPEPVATPVAQPAPRPVPQPEPMPVPPYMAPTPAAPKKKSGGKVAVIAIIVVVILALIGVAAWAVADGLILEDLFSLSGGKENQGENGGNGDVNGGDLTAYDCGGLTIYLPEDYKENSRSDGSACFDNFNVIVYVAASSRQDGIKTGDDMAQSFAAGLTGFFDSVAVKSAGSVSYVRAQDDDADNAELYCFYIDGDTCWEVRASVYDPEKYESEAVKAITTCKIG